jgi:hypothetical protein
MKAKIIINDIATEYAQEKLRIIKAKYAKNSKYIIKKSLNKITE